MFAQEGNGTEFCQGCAGYGMSFRYGNGWVLRRDAGISEEVGRRETTVECDPWCVMKEKWIVAMDRSYWQPSIESLKLTGGIV